jgi:hypothetical protein
MSDKNFVLEGPHCMHDDCGWSYCELVDFEGDDYSVAVRRFCKEVRRCTTCGPSSGAWTKLVAEWTAWVIGWCGTDDPALLREKQVPANVIEVAGLIAAHPMPVK